GNGACNAPARSTWTWRENSRLTVPTTTRRSSPRAHSCWAASCNRYARRSKDSAWATARSRLARRRASALTLTWPKAQLRIWPSESRKRGAPCTLVGGHHEAVVSVVDVAFRRLCSSVCGRARAVDRQRRAHARRCPAHVRECGPDEYRAGLRME